MPCSRSYTAHVSFSSASYAASSVGRSCAAYVVSSSVCPRSAKISAADMSFLSLVKNPSAVAFSTPSLVRDRVPYHQRATTSGRAIASTRPYAPSTHTLFWLSTIHVGSAMPSDISWRPSGWPYSSRFLRVASSVSALYAFVSSM